MALLAVMLVLASSAISTVRGKGGGGYVVTGGESRGSTPNTRHMNIICGDAKARLTRRRIIFIPKPLIPRNWMKIGVPLSCQQAGIEHRHHNRDSLMIPWSSSGRHVRIIRHLRFVELSIHINVSNKM
jgi:hypothetical protein